MSRKPSEAQFATLVVGAREGLEHRIATSQRSADFGDVVARAHALDPGKVSARAVQEAGSWAPVVDIRTSTAQSNDEVLDDVLVDVRGALQRMVSQRRMAPIAPLAAGDVRRDSAANTRRGLMVGLALVAAAVLVWFGVDVVPELVPPGDPPAKAQAFHINADNSSEGLAEQGEPVPPRPPPIPDADDEPVVVPEQPVQAAEPPRPRVSAAERRAARIKALDAEAQRLWRAGDKRGAEALLRKLVRIGGRSRAAEMAYADLFVLAHQAHGGTERRKLWRGYLKRFPRGRFADDARGGLCRLADIKQRQGCWAAYLDDFPRGSYRGDARRAVGKGAK